NVVRIRNEKGYSQLKLAIEIGLSGASYLGRMELRTKNHRFNLEHLAKISKVLDVDIKEFFKPV
ncbi:MAG: helix-turn-helix domain-containing protein, partial [Sulfurospirillum sp.]